MLPGLKTRLVNAVTALVLILGGITTVNAGSDCASWLIQGPAALFNRGLSIRKIDNLMSDYYSTNELNAFVEGNKTVAANAAILDQARPRQAITPAPEIGKNLKLITDRILAAWPHTTPEFNVYLTSWRFYTPFTTLDGDLLVPIGFLQRARSDDEVTFLLAHEISHLLLGHPMLLATSAKQKKSLRVFQKKGKASASYAAATLTLVALTQREANWMGTASELTKLNRQVFQYYSRLRDFTTEFIHPAWQSKQEDQADLLALELLLLAGYSPDGVEQALENLQTAEESFCESIKAFSSNFEDFVNTEFEENVKANLMVGNLDFKDILVRESVEFSKKKVAELLVRQALPKTHRPYEKRREYIWKYVDRPGMQDLMEVAEERDTVSEVVDTIHGLDEFRSLFASSQAIDVIEDALLADDIAMAEKNMPALANGSQQIMVLKYRYRLAQGEHGLASENIVIAMQDEYPSLVAYEIYFAEQLADGHFEAVTEQLIGVEKLYGDSIHFLPEEIFMSASIAAEHNKDLADKPDTDAMLKRCTDSNRDYIEGPCYAAALGTRADFRTRYEEILAGTECTTVEETGGDVVCANTKKKNVFSKLKVWEKFKNNEG
jgi:hypothetical protein